MDLSSLQNNDENADNLDEFLKDDKPSRRAPDNVTGAPFEDDFGADEQAPEPVDEVRCE